MSSWVDGAAGSAYDADNLPYGVFVREGEEPRVGARIGDYVLDLAPVAATEMLDVHAVFGEATLNELLAQGRPVWDSVRTWLVGLVTDETERDLVEPHLVPLAEVELRMPFAVGDYVDFYASLDHASNVGKIFRPDAEPLLPNWRHLPVGYHGRGGTVVPSGTPVDPTVRPGAGRRRSGLRAQHAARHRGRARLRARRPARSWATRCRRTPSPTTCSAWSGSTTGRRATSRPGSTCRSARSSASPSRRRSRPGSRRWLPSTTPGSTCRVRTRSRCPYLAPGDTHGLDIDVEVVLNGEVVSRPPYRTMYWSPAQMLAHLTVNGASIRPGDLFASGTISGPEKDQRGSFLELCWGGAEPMADGRTFLEDGDEVVLRYSAPGTGGGRIALGEVAGRVEPAR